MRWIQVRWLLRWIALSSGAIPLFTIIVNSLTYKIRQARRRWKEGLFSLYCTTNEQTDDCGLFRVCEVIREPLLLFGKTKILCTVEVYVLLRDVSTSSLGLRFAPVFNRKGNLRGPNSRKGAVPSPSCASRSRAARASTGNWHSHFEFQICHSPFNFEILIVEININN